MPDDHSTKNPCVKVCKFSTSGDTGVCRACFRTRYEVRHWKRLSDPERTAVNQRVRPLMEAEAPARGPKKLRKVEKRIAKLERRLCRLEEERRALLAQAAEGRSNR